MGTGGGGVPRVFGCEEKLVHVSQKHKGAQIPGWIGAGCIVQSVAEPARIMVVITRIHPSTNIVTCNLPTMVPQIGMQG